MLKFLGRGSAFNSKEGNTSAYYITKKNNLILFDCGSTVFQKLQEKNLINGRNRIIVLVTHLHSDHIGSLSTLIEYCYYVLKNKVEVIYPDWYQITKILNLLGVTQDMYKCILNCNRICNDDPQVYKRVYLLQIHNPEQVSFRVVPTFHVYNFKCYSYIVYFEEVNTTIYYSGDTNEELSDSEQLFKCLKVIDEGHKNVFIYHDTCIADYEGNVHTPLRYLKEIIPEDKRKYVYCMHFDKDEAITQAKEAGFNVVENEGDNS